MALIDLDLFGSNTVVDSSTPGVVDGELTEIDVLSISAGGPRTLTIDGLTGGAAVGFTAGASLASPLTIAAINDTDVSVDFGLIGLSAGSSLTYAVGDSSSISVNPSAIDLSLFGGQNVAFTGEGAGSFTWEGAIPLIGSSTINVTGFGAGDSLNIPNGDFGSFTYSPITGVATLTYTGGAFGAASIVYSIDGMDPALAEEIAADPESFIQPDGSLLVPCFLAGTMIAVPGGERAVEELAIGDLVLTATGETRPVRWIGHRVMHRAFGDKLLVHPVRITAGALGDNLPVRDLLVSPDHALLLDGVLVQAGALVNGTTIAREKPADVRFTYYHIELEGHELVLAEGVAAETFVDNVTRSRFDNYAEFVALYGEQAMEIAEMDLPRVKSARQLPEGLRARLAADVTVAA